MNIVWPNRAEGLPPGQRLLTAMPRFGDRPHLPPLPQPTDPILSVTQGDRILASLDVGDLQRIGVVDIVADFHCVTTWSVRAVRWTGVPMTRLCQSIGIDATIGGHVVAHAADHRRANLTYADSLTEDVLVAVRSNGRELDALSGGPFRLVAPDLYGYKSIKHLTRLDFTSELPRRLGKEHPRGRVAFEERHPVYPSWLVKPLYRMLIPMTAAIAARSASRIESTSKESRTS